MSDAGNNEDFSDFADLLRRYTGELGISYNELARRSTIPFYTLRNWTRGTSVPRAWRDVIRLARALRLSEVDTNRLLAASNHPTLAELRRLYPNEREVLDNWTVQGSSAPIGSGPKPYPHPPPRVTPSETTPPRPWYKRLTNQATMLALWFSGAGSSTIVSLVLSVAAGIAILPIAYAAMGYFAPPGARFAWDSDLLACVAVAALGLAIPFSFAITWAEGINVPVGVGRWTGRAMIFIGAGLGYAVAVGIWLLVLAVLAAILMFFNAGTTEFLFQPSLRTIWAIILTAAALFGCYWGIEQGEATWQTITTQLPMKWWNWLLMLLVPFAAGPFLGFILYFGMSELRSAWLGPVLALVTFLTAWYYREGLWGSKKR